MGIVPALLLTAAAVLAGLTFAVIAARLTPHEGCTCVFCTWRFERRRRP
jgi:hypothetical protein